MKQMKILTVNGQSYQITDEEALHYTPQTLTPQQKAQGRENLEACTWQEAADKLCADFTEQGPIVSCQPVAGLPLTVVSKLVPKQSGSGDPTPDNVRTVSGHPSIDLRRTGRNLLYTAYKGGTMNGVTCTANGDGTFTVNGTATADTSFRVVDVATNRVPFLGTHMTLSGCPAGGSASSYFLWLDWSGHRDTGNGITIARANWFLDYWTKQISIVIKAGTTVSNLVFKPQITAGSEVQPFQPYRGDSFTAALGQTVYGGTYHWQTGQLQIGYTSIVLDGVTAGKMVTLTDPGVKTYAYFTPVTKPKAGGNIVSDRLKCSIAGAGKVILVPMAKTVSAVADDATDAQVVETFNQVLKRWYDAGTPLTVVYEMEQPVTVSLTPQEIVALSGTNNLFSTTGDTQVSGKADTNALIQTLSDKVNALCETVSALTEG